MTHGSLFSGIGGFDLAAQWMGWENVFHCEIAEFPRKVLHHYWPNAISYENIKETDFKCHRGRIDVISGGFPCQPYSLAGKRLGKEDDRHLWPEMLRCIREIQPKWVVGENVFGIVNWSGGLVFDEVQSDLEVEGYEVQAYVLPACAVNAPHRRDRVWFVAHAADPTRKQNQRHGQGRFFTEPAGADEQGLASDPDNRSTRQAVRTQQENAKYCGNGRDGNAPDPDSSRFSLNTCGKLAGISGQDATFQGSAACRTHAAGNGWQKFPTQSPVCRRDDGLSSRLDGITFSKWRNESIKAYGNAIVPQVVYEIFKAIEEWENKY